MKYTNYEKKHKLFKSIYTYAIKKAFFLGGGTIKTPYLKSNDDFNKP